MCIYIYVYVCRGICIGTCVYVGNIGPSGGPQRTVRDPLRAAGLPLREVREGLPGAGLPAAGTALLHANNGCGTPQKMQDEYDQITFVPTMFLGSYVGVSDPCP